MIVLMALLFRCSCDSDSSRAAREQANKGLAGSMEGHAAMDMCIQYRGRFGTGCAPRR